MFVLGVGIGGVMQVLVIAVQNAVRYEDLGVATAGATFFRSIGGSFGTAVFGAIFANALGGNLRHYLSGIPLPAGFSGAAGASPAVLNKLPLAVHNGYVHAFAASLHTVFLVAIPIAAASFAMTWLLKEVPLRQTSQAPNPADTLAPTAMPAQRTSADEIGRALTVLMGRQARTRVYERLSARAGLDLDPRSCWTLLRLEEHPGEDVAGLAHQLQIPGDVVGSLADGLAERGYLRSNGEVATSAPRAGQLLLTTEGRQAVDALVAARRDGLADLVHDWGPEHHDELAQLLSQLARQLTGEPAPTP
jgi:hypothetical protein